MSKLKALIVDDERLSRLDLKTRLSAYQEIRVVAEADSVSSALSALNEQDIDVVFLDIQLSGESGFDLLPKIKGSMRVIFVTAHDDYACRAFEINALDYILKPIHPKRLDDSIRRLLESGILVPKTSDQLISHSDLLYLALDETQLFIQAKEVVCIISEGNRSRVHTSDHRQFVVRKSLKEWEKVLSDRVFLRINRKVIISLYQIDRAERISSRQTVTLKGTAQLNFLVSRRKISLFNQRLSSLN
ncbi:MAG: LytTR family DNA-binding domain-containing protein [Verrucomicrobiota bacterium]